MIVILCAGQAISTSGATYRGQNIDGKKYSGSTELKGVVVPVSLQFDGKYVSVVIDGAIVDLELESEEIKDPTAITASDGQHKWLLRIIDLDC